MDVHFECTNCGKCCRDLKIPLSIDEAITWTTNGHQVHLLVEGLPWPGEPDAGDARAIYNKDRSFPAISGEIPIRIGITPVAWHEGACPWLQTDLRCGQYDQRPRACRIYPLIGRPFEALDIGTRLCPPEAWNNNAPVLTNDKGIANPELAQVVADYRISVTEDITTLMRTCAILGWSFAGFANEGFAVLETDPQELADALVRARANQTCPPIATQWTYVTNRRSTLATLQAAGCQATLVCDGPGYLGSFPAEP